MILDHILTRILGQFEKIFMEAYDEKKIKFLNALYHDCKFFCNFSHVWDASDNSTKSFDNDLNFEGSSLIGKTRY